MAEKLRAILQQVQRNRNRPQDVLDVAVMVQTYPSLDRQVVGQFLLRKGAARSIAVRKSLFSSPEVERRAWEGYSDLENLTRVRFIPFDEALQAVQALVDSLPIPD